MKRVFCLLICLVMVLGLLPAAAGAASDIIDEVSISGLEHPVAGLELDQTYKIPNRSIQYSKDRSYDEVTWIDADSGKTMKAGAEAEQGHSYIAVLHLLADDGEFRSKGVDVELSYDMECRVIDIETEIDDDELTIKLSYETDFYFDRKNPVQLTLEELSGGTVPAGELPWTESDFGFTFGKITRTKGLFDMTVTWYKGKEDIDKYQMTAREEFEAGQIYTLKIELDSSRSTQHAYFDPDTEILLNGKKANYTYVGNDAGYTIYALFRFTASSGIDKITIKGIEEPKVDGPRQRSGFTCSTDGVDEVLYDKWEVVGSNGVAKDFRGNFEAGNQYLLTLQLIPEDGYALDLTKKSVSVNSGTVVSVELDDDSDDGCWIVVISFDVGDTLLTGIEVTTPPRKTEYYIGERFSDKGMVVTATYNDGHTEKVTDYEFDPEGKLDKEDTVITISYTEEGVTVETELNITVIDEDLTLTGLVITRQPKKRSYKTGEAFDPTGMVVTAVYDDKSTAEVTNFEIDPEGKLTLDDEVITIRYSEGKKTATAEVTIKVTLAQRILSELVITREPDKMTYYEGEYFDPTGMILTAIYEDETKEVVTDYYYAPRTALNRSDKMVVFYYTDKYAGVAKSVTLEIKVKETSRELSALLVSTPPTKTVYTVGEEFDPAGMVITAVYDDKSQSEVKSYTIEPTGKLTEDVKAITITFTENKITKTVTQRITVKPVQTNPFTDVKEGDYFYDAVLWAFYHDPQVTNGMTDTEFGPNLTCTRAQVVTFIWRAAGKPTPKTQTNPFKDVAENSWYRDAVLWAVETGITNGTGADTFSPGDTCSVAHVITFLYRAAGEPNKTASPETWYTDAMNWAFDTGLFKDLSFSEIQPKLDCPRRDIVSFLYHQLG